MAAIKLTKINCPSLQQVEFNQPLKGLLEPNADDPNADGRALKAVAVLAVPPNAAVAGRRLDVSLSSCAESKRYVRAA